MSSARLEDQRRHNFFVVDNEVVDAYIESIPENRRADALAVYTVLARHADANGVAWPGVEYIGRKIGRSKPTVIDAVKELGRLGLLGKEERYDDSGAQKTNVYLLLPVDKGGVKEIDGGGKQDLREGVNRIYTKNTQIEEDQEKNSRRDADASASVPSVMKNPFGYYCEVAKALRVEIVPEDRKDTAKHFKDLVRMYDPTEEELKRVVSKMLEARTAGAFWSPQKALEKVRGSFGNVTQLRPMEPVRPRKRVIS